MWKRRPRIVEQLDSCFSQEWDNIPNQSPETGHSSQSFKYCWLKQRGCYTAVPTFLRHGALIKLKMRIFFFYNGTFPLNISYFYCDLFGMRNGFTRLGNYCILCLCQVFELCLYNIGCLCKCPKMPAAVRTNSHKNQMFGEDRWSSTALLFLETNDIIRVRSCCYDDTTKVQNVSTFQQQHLFTELYFNVLSGWER